MTCIVSKLHRVVISPSASHVHPVNKLDMRHNFVEEAIEGCIQLAHHTDIIARVGEALLFA